MARNGYRIFDADTHVRPDADLLEPYLPVATRALLKQYENFKARNKEGAVTYLMGERKYKRRLGVADDQALQRSEYMSGYNVISTENPIRFASAIQPPGSGTWTSKGLTSI